MSMKNGLLTLGTYHLLQSALRGATASGNDTFLGKFKHFALFESDEVLNADGTVITSSQPVIITLDKVTEGSDVTHHMHLSFEKDWSENDIANGMVDVDSTGHMTVRWLNDAVAAEIEEVVE